MKKFIKVNGINMCYEEEGEGKPLILIHGLTGSKATMIPVREALGEGRKYISVDVRGHGESELTEGYTLETHADDIADLIGKLGLEKADVLGWSMGSYIGLNIAEKYPELIDHMILLCTKPSGKTSSVEAIVTKAGFNMTTISPEKMFELILQAAMSPEHYEAMNRGEFKLDLTAVTGIVMSPEAKEAESKSLANFDLSGAYDKVTCKTLVIAGEYDGINPAWMGKEVADGIGCPYVEIKGAGHLVPHEQPEAFRKAVFDFLGS